MNLFKICLLSTAVLRAAAGDGVVIGASVNGSVNAVVYRGWPALIGASMIHSRWGAEDAEPVEIRSDKGWSSAITLRLLNSSGDQVFWTPLHPGDPEDPAVTVPVKGSVAARWFLDPDTTSQLPAGKYKLQVGVEYSGNFASARTVSISIEDEPDPLTDAQQSSKARMWATYSALTGDRAKAKEVLDTFLASHIKDVPALELRGDVCEPAERYAAMNYYRQALAAINENTPAAPEQPVVLVTKFNAALSAFLEAR